MINRINLINRYKDISNLLNNEIHRKLLKRALFDVYEIDAFKIEEHRYWVNTQYYILSDIKGKKYVNRQEKFE